MGYGAADNYSLAIWGDDEMKRGLAATCVFHGLILAGLISLVMLMMALENQNVLIVLTRHP